MAKMKAGSKSKHEEMAPERPGAGESAPKRQLTGLYLALLVAGFMLIGQALEAFLMWKLQARLGLALLATAVIIGVSKERMILGVALIILWGGFLMTVLH